MNFSTSFIHICAASPKSVRLWITVLSYSFDLRTGIWFFILLFLGRFFASFGSSRIIGILLDFFFGSLHSLVVFQKLKQITFLIVRIIFLLKVSQRNLCLFLLINFLVSKMIEIFIHQMMSIFQEVLLVSCIASRCWSGSSPAVSRFILWFFWLEVVNFCLETSFV